MKKYSIISIILGLFILNCNNVFCQQLTDENTYIINQYFQTKIEIASKMSDNKEVSAEKANYLRQIQNSAIIIDQVGYNNVIDVKQKGIDAQKVNQIGNDNYYNYINFYNNSPSNFNIIQQGNSNNLQIYGENSIIKNIGIFQKSNFNTLIIKNY